MSNHNHCLSHFAALQLANITAREVPDAKHAIMRLTGLEKLSLAALDTTDEARLVSLVLSA